MFCGGFVLPVLAQRDLLMYSLPANFYFPRKNDKLPRNDSTNSQQKVSRVWIGIYAMKAGKRRQSCVVVKCDRKWKYRRDLVDPVSGFIEASAVNDLSRMQAVCRSHTGRVDHCMTWEPSHSKSLRKQQFQSYDREVVSIQKKCLLNGFSQVTSLSLIISKWEQTKSL